MSQKRKKSIKTLADAVRDCFISSNDKGTIISNIEDPALCSKWPKLKLTKVPDIFLHKPVDFAEHAKKLLCMGITFNQPYLSRYYTKITCPTFNDHKALIQYFDKNQLPYNTFGQPQKRKMKVVIRGLPKDIDLNNLKTELKSHSVPVIRLHEMKRRQNIKDKNTLILAVVPYNEEGKKLLQVKKILGHNVTVEPPKSKTKQCHRCQMWGHTQRYCHGKIKCVKCAGEHLSKKCERDASVEPPKCANCGGEHTANYKQCPCCPDSLEHQRSIFEKNQRIQVLYRHTDIVTMENVDTLYKNIIYKTKLKN